MIWKEIAIWGIIVGLGLSTFTLGLAVHQNSARIDVLSRRVYDLEQSR